jgi:thiosulfate reductase cytochrome b subunit
LRWPRPGGYLITAFFFIHVYLTTTGHTVFAHIKAMITGWEEVALKH